jgi:hypothetical protein
MPTAMAADCRMLTTPLAMPVQPTISTPSRPPTAAAQLSNLWFLLSDSDDEADRNNDSRGQQLAQKPTLSALPEVAVAAALLQAAVGALPAAAIRASPEAEIKEFWGNAGIVTCLEVCKAAATDLGIEQPKDFSHVTNQDLTDRGVMKASLGTIVAALKAMGAFLSQIQDDQ